MNSPARPHPDPAAARRADDDGWMHRHRQPVRQSGQHGRAGRARRLRTHDQGTHGMATPRRLRRRQVFFSNCARRSTATLSMRQPAEAVFVLSMPETGESVWDTDTDSPLSGGPGVGDGLVLLGTSDGEVLALGDKDGEIRWRARVSSEVLSSPAAQGGIAVARTIDGKLFRLEHRRRHTVVGLRSNCPCG